MLSNETYYEFGARCFHRGDTVAAMLAILGYPSSQPFAVDAVLKGYRTAQAEASRKSFQGENMEGVSKFTGKKVIGFSLGRCVRSLVLGEVALDDVVVVISQTAIRADYELEDVINGYMGRRGYLMGLDHDTCLLMARRLRDSGKLHQPRLQGQAAGYATKEVWAIVDLNDVEVKYV